jgi:hypothetical protein
LRAGSRAASESLRKAVDESFAKRKWLLRGQQFRRSRRNAGPSRARMPAPFLPPVVRIGGIAHRYEGGKLVPRFA